MAVILNKTELGTISFIGQCGFPWEAKEGLEAENERDKEALNESKWNGKCSDYSHIKKRFE